MWNVTYGTTTDVSIANGTDGSCDLSRLSYQSWNHTEYIDVQADSSGNVSVPTIAKVSWNFSAPATGQYLLSDASSGSATSFAASVVLLAVTAVLSAAWHV